MMAKERYETGKAPELAFAECSGDVVIRGWVEPAVMVKGDHQLVEADDTLSISARGSVKVWVPVQARLSLASVAGDVAVKGVEGPIQVGEVMGDLACKGLGEALIGSVHGDMAARNVSGPLKLGQIMGDVALRSVQDVKLGAVHGDLALRYVEGSVEVESVMGDANLHTVNGDVTITSGQRDANLANLGGRLNVEQVAGDVRLQGGLPGGKHHCRAQGDIVVRWPSDAALNVLISAPEVRNRLPLRDVVEKEGSFSGRIGDGETQLVLEAQGRVILKELDAGEWDGDPEEWVSLGAGLADMGRELAGLGAQLSDEINTHMAEFSARMEEQLGGEFAQKMADKAARRTEKAMHKAMRQAERMRSQTTAWTPTSPPPSSHKSNEPSAEEQVKILSMLEKGIISVEEAENLLKALEE